MGGLPPKKVDIMTGQDILQEVSKMLVPHITRSSTSTETTAQPIRPLGQSSSARSLVTSEKFRRC